ncbi:MAG: DUF1273 domain-containing protein [Clostridiales bacterium]|nr:DUF1273 domain-containing protein [Clostridiales bacterium]
MRRVAKEEYDLERQLSVCFTGHRPDKLPWGEYEDEEDCVKLKKQLEAEIVRAYKEGARYFLSGMADGFDVYAAEAVLRLSWRCPGMKLVTVFPFGWGDTPRKRRIEKRAFRSVSLHESYVRTSYMERNYFLVKNSARIIAGFSGDEASGTAATLRMAKREGLGVVILSV